MNVSLFNVNRHPFQTCAETIFKINVYVSVPPDSLRVPVRVHVTPLDKNIVASSITCVSNKLAFFSVNCVFIDLLQPLKLTTDAHTFILN